MDYPVRFHCCKNSKLRLLHFTR